MSFVDFLLLASGLAILIVGGEALVRAASSLALRAGVTPLVIGLVVVSAATSAPEFAVTLDAVVGGEPGLAVGNVVGSNIVNVLLILGLSAALLPLVIQRQIVRFDIPVMLALSVAVLLVSLDRSISRFEGTLLLAGLIFHVIVSVRVGRKANAETREVSDQFSASKLMKIWFALPLLVGAIALLAFGARLLVSGAVNIASSLGVSGLIIGLTVVAVGTSLPELVTTLIAIRRGERDMAVGNIVGSNIFNVGLVLGIPALLVTEGIPIPSAAISVDIPIMIAAALALLPITFTGFAIARWEGGLFVLIYIAYVVFLIFDATGHDAATGFTNLMLWFVLPLIAATLIAVTFYEIGVFKGRKSATKI